MIKKLLKTVLLILVCVSAYSQQASRVIVSQAFPLQPGDNPNILGWIYDGVDYRIYAFDKWKIIDTVAKVATKTNLLSRTPISRTITINGVTQDLSTNRSWTILSKRTETYSGNTGTGGTGTVTVTFPVSFSVAPNIQASIINGTDSQNLRITSITTTGATVLVRNRVDVVGLLPTWVNVNNANVDILVTEK